VLRVGEVEEGGKEIQGRRVGRDGRGQGEMPAGVVEREGGIAHDAPALGGDFDHFGLAVEEVKGYGLEGIAATGKPPVHRVRGC
jgi:hypothetical protein